MVFFLGLHIHYDHQQPTTTNDDHGPQLQPPMMMTNMGRGPNNGTKQPQFLKKNLLTANAHKQDPNNGVIWVVGLEMRMCLKPRLFYLFN